MKTTIKKTRIEYVKAYDENIKIQCCNFYRWMAHKPIRNAMRTEDLYDIWLEDRVATDASKEMQ